MDDMVGAQTFNNSGAPQAMGLECQEFAIRFEEIAGNDLRPAGACLGAKSPNLFRRAVARARNSLEPDHLHGLLLLACFSVV